MKERKNTVSTKTALLVETPTQNSSYSTNSLILMDKPSLMHNLLSIIVSLNY